MNWSKTYQYYKDLGVEKQYVKPSQQKQEEHFESIIKNPSNGQLNGEVKRVIHQIYRDRDKNGKEWLRTFEMRQGLNTFKDPTDPQAFNNVGIHYKPIFQTRLIPNVEKNEIEKKIEGPTGFEIIHEEDYAFTKAKAKELWALRDPHNITLAIAEDDSGRNPIEIESFDDFINEDFDRLKDRAQKTQAVQTENQSLKQLTEMIAKALTTGNASPEVKRTAERVLEEQAPVNV